MPVVSSRPQQFWTDFISSWRQQSEDVHSEYADTMHFLDRYTKNQLWYGIEDIAPYGQRREEKAGWGLLPTTNVLDVIRQQKVDSLVSDDFLITVDAVAEKDEDISKAMVFQAILRQVWRTTNAYQTVVEGVRAGTFYPAGVTRVEYNDDTAITKGDDHTMGNIIFTNVPVANFFWDSRAKTIDDAEFAFEVLKNISIKRLMNVPVFNQKLVRQIFQERATIKYMIPDWGTSGWTQEMDELAAKESVDLQVVFYRYDVNTTQPKVAKAFIVEDKVLYSIDETGDTMLPYSIFREFNDPFLFLGYSSVMRAIPNQKIINRLDASMAYIVEMNRRPPVAINLEQTNIHEWSAFTDLYDEPGSVIGVNGNPAEVMRVVPLGKIEPGMIDFKQQLVQQTFLMGGVSPFYLGRTGSVTTTGGVQQLAATSQSTRVDTKLNLQRYVKRLVQLVILQLHKIKGEVRMRLDQDNPLAETEDAFIKMNIQDYKNLRYRLKIEVPLSSTEKMKERREMMELLSLGAQTGQTFITPPDVIKAANFHNGAELLRNMKASQRQREIQEVIQAAQMGALAGMEVLQSGEARNMSPQMAAQTIGGKVAQAILDVGSVNPKQKQATQAPQGGTPNPLGG